MKIRKSVAYAFPSSKNAEIMGCEKTGCWHVSQYIKLEDHSWSAPFIPAGTEGDSFQLPYDPDLIALYNEIDGDPCPYFLMYSEQDLLSVSQ